ncbi:MAG: galactokinase [Bifidobacteriaceae bacterium]|nr:galactokinase [Bifidobacteriaceae bacterium]
MSRADSAPAASAAADGPQFAQPWSDAEGAERVRAGFRAVFGSEPAGVWAAPGRVNLIGEHTDYNGGLALPIALPHRTFCAASTAPDDTARLASAQLGGGGEVWESAMADVAPGQVEGWGAYAVGVIWALRRAGVAAPALRGFVNSCVPFGAGLSSSAALEAAIALPCQDLRGAAGCRASYGAGVGDEAGTGDRAGVGDEAGTGDAAGTGDGASDGAGVGDEARTGDRAGASAGARTGDRAGTGAGAGACDGTEPFDRAWLAERCVEAENLIAGAPTGGMDQAAALRAEAGRALLVDSSTGAAETVPFDLVGAGLELLVMDTRAEHAHAGGEYGARRATCEAAAARLGVEELREIPPARLGEALATLGGPDSLAGRRVRHVVTEIERTRQFVAALRAGRYDRLGALMDASHASLRDDYEVSAPGLDLAVDSARAAGALGARMTGGGFGGSAIALVEAGQAGAVAAAVAAAFAAAGFNPPVFLRALPSSPATRVA